MSQLMPGRLYKYQSLSLENISNLKEQVIYFGSPKNFNDPYDCALMPKICRPTDEDIQNILQKTKSEKSSSGLLRALKVLPSTIDQIKDKVEIASKLSIEKIVYEFGEEKGISFFTERNDSLLMWSHYGGNYKGFCLEFSTNCELFSKAQKVKYDDNLPNIDIINYLLGKKVNVSELLFCTKSKDWMYEEEWRVLHKDSGTKFVYEQQELTGIYFGPDMEEQWIEIICLILKGQNENVRFWRGRRSNQEFKVDFDEVSYMSFMDSKHLGFRKEISIK